MPVVGAAFNGMGVGAGPMGWQTGSQYYDESSAAANAAGNQNYRLQGLRGQQDKAIADQQAALQREALAQKSGQFNQVFGGLQGLLGQAGSGAYGVGGTNTPLPQIDASPIWNPQQVQERVNSQRSGLLAGAQGQQQQLANKMSGMGFGGRSPALLSQQSNLMAQARAAAAQGENDTRWQAAQGNAGQVLKGQLGQQQQWQDYNQADIERRKTATGLTASLASALSGLI